MTKKERAFVRTVKRFYDRHRRHSLPWRKTYNPYRILVSEIMLQQTQVERVVPKYKSFLGQFPNVKKLAAAPLSEVLKTWQGLGYNRRAKMLHECAKVVVDKYKGRFPKTYGELCELPGVGPYTAGAVMAFAYNKAVPLIETNVRTVFLHHFFQGKTEVADKEIVKLIERTLQHDNPRAWYAALMDYGVHLKREHGNQNHRSRHYTKQSPFEGSDRQVRGAILRLLAERSYTISEFMKKLTFEQRKILDQLESLKNEGLVVVKNRRCSLPA